MSGVTRGLQVAVLFFGVLLMGVMALRVSEVATTAAQEKAAAPPEGQTYVGSKQCASCHFEQQIAWKKTKHSKALDELPAKYKQDAACLKCHTTGFGEETGYKQASDTHLAGISCEACHGPGSKHVEISKQFANKKKLSKEEEQICRGSTHKFLPHNVCVTCHLMQGHKAHPAYDKEKK